MRTTAIPTTCHSRRTSEERWASVTLLGILILLQPGMVIAQTYNEGAKLVAADATTADQFGYAVSLSGNTLVVGAPYVDCGAGIDCGAAYVYGFDGVSWVQQAKLTVSDAMAGQRLGTSAAIDGDTIVVGAEFEEGAYVFVRPGGGWSDMTQTAKLTALDSVSGDAFGWSVAISGDTIAVGAKNDDCVAGFDCGSAYVFVRPGGGWSDMTHTAKLTSSDVEEFDNLGYSVSISGDTVVAGAYNDDCPGGVGCGSAYVFVKPGAFWSDMTQTAKLTPSDNPTGAELGLSVAIDGDTVVAGAIFHDCIDGFSCGLAYVFVKPGGTWSNMTETARLAASDAATADFFGRSVAISGNRIVVGAFGDNCTGGADFCGSAYVFVRNAFAWVDETQDAKLVPTDAELDNNFGVSVAISGDRIVAGADGDNCLAGGSCGSAYVLGPFRVYVDGYAEGLNNGTNWTDAYLRLQDALNYASMHAEVTEIWVADGTYTPDQGGGAIPGDRTATFQLLDGVSIYGGFAGGETALSERDVLGNFTTLSGDLLGDDGPGLYEDYAENSYHIITASGVGAASILDGFTIIGGNANGISLERFGGGMRVSSGSPTVRNCTFQDNVALDSGGAVVSEGGSPVFRGCTFLRNAAQGMGGSRGGAIANRTTGSLGIVQSLFTSNSATNSGGAIHTQGSATTTVVRAYLYQNSAAAGGAVSSESAGITNLYDCDFWLNSATGNGGTVRNASTGTTTLRNCTIGQNTAVVSGAGIYIGAGTVDVKNSILWGNSDAGGMDSSAQFHVAGGTACLNYSIIQGGWSGCGGTGVLSSDPLYFDPASYNHFLFQNSPAVDAGDNNAVPADSLDLDEDGDTTERLPLDAYGRDRFTNNPLASEAGMTAPGYPDIVDMGAYETPLILYWYVDADATGNNNGTSWTHAFTKLQDGLAATGTAPNEEIWVAQGTYYPDQGVGITPGDRTATFQMISGVGLYGGFAGFENDLSERNIEANPTILSGDLNGDDGPNFANYAENSYHVVTANGVDATAILDGFSMSGGNSDDFGGGYESTAGGATLRSCRFEANQSLIGGGGARLAGGGDTLFENCRFEDNHSGPAPSGYGAGLYANGADCRLIACVFKCNVAGHSAGGTYLANGTFTVSETMFLDNLGLPQAAGAVRLEGLAQANLLNCGFFGNQGAIGGAVLNASTGDVSFTNSLFSGNSATSSNGGAAANLSGTTSTLNFTNCTFHRNTAVGFGGGIESGQINSGATVQNCIFWGNSDTTGSGASSQISAISAVVSYSLVEGGWSGAGSNNLNLDPLFVDSDGPDNVVGTSDDNLRLLPSSPAIDSADTTALPTDTADLDGDANTNEVIPFDLAGNPRRIDDPDVDDTGAGSAPIVDMGAYEFLANVMFVDASATGNDDGSSWANAYTTLQSALTSAGILNSGITEIWVADGTYKPDQGGKETPGDRSSSFRLLDKVTVYGGFAGGETTLGQRNSTASVTILSGDLAGNDALVTCAQNSPDCDAFGLVCVDGSCIIADNNDENSYHVVTGSGTDASAVLDGFTITAGNSILHGGGYFSDGGGATIRNCKIETNQSSFIGGGASLVNSGTTTFESCQFLHNTNTGSGGGAGLDVLFGANAVIDRCLFMGNISPTSSGGGMAIQDSATAIIKNTDFTGNFSFNSGGGLRLSSPTNATLENCRFFGNRTTGTGAGLFNSSSGTVSVLNCTFSGNIADTQGGGISANLPMGAVFAVTNSSFSQNHAGPSHFGGGIGVTGSSPVTVQNCVLWGNFDATSMGSGASAQVFGAGATVTYSILQGGWSGAGSNNSSADPLFVDGDGADDNVGTEDDDLRLLPTSPAIDAANTPALPLDTDDADGDGNTTERYPFDLAGKPRILDDPDTEDTGVPGSPVVDMGAYEYFVDCNGNGIPDQCDLSCGAPTGPCDIPGCGGSSDCDPGKGENNGIPDECDIVGCFGDTDCDDCNLNGVPDGCDIASAGSLDVNPMDGIPDECSQFDPGCIADNDWSCWNNWNIPGDVYPDNTGPVTYSVTLDADDDVFLDVDVTIDTLRIMDDSVLNVTQTGSAGDLTVVESGGVLLESKLFAGIGRVIDLTSGPLVVRGRGAYSAPPLRDKGRASARAGVPGLHDTSASVNAADTAEVSGVFSNQAASSTSGPSRGGPVCGNLVCEAGETACNCTSDFCGACMDVPDVVFSDCDPCAPGMCPDEECGIFLSGTMALTVEGNLILDGTDACPCDATTSNCGLGGGLRGGILPPPKFRAVDLSQANVTGNFSILRSVGLIHSTSLPLDLGGSFNNQATVPQCFNWSAGGIAITNLGPTPAPIFEVAGRDLGPVEAGFGNALDSNFSMQSLDIAPGARIRLTNDHANAFAAGACQEALYVRTLTLGAGAVVTLDNVHLFYDTLVNNGGTISPQGCAAFLEVAPCSQTSDCFDGNTCTVDSCDTESESCSHIAIADLIFGDADNTGVVDSDDILCVLGAFQGFLSDGCPLERADLWPCEVPSCVTSSDCAGSGTGSLCLINLRCGCASDDDCLSGVCDHGRCRLLDVDDILAILDAFIGLPPLGQNCPATCP